MNTSTAPQKPKRARLWLKRLAWSFAWLVTLTALAVVVINWSGARAWKAYVRDLEASGKSLDPASLQPPQVPDELNMAKAPVFVEILKPIEINNPSSQKILITLDTSIKQPELPRWNAGELLDQGSWQQYFRSSYEQIFTPDSDAQKYAPEIWKEFFKRTAEHWKGAPPSPSQDILFALGALDQKLQEVEAASKRPEWRFPSADYTNHWYTYHERCNRSFQMLSKIFALRAVARLNLGQSDEALEDVRLVWRLGDAFLSARDIVGLYESPKLSVEALQPVWEGLVQHQWKEEQLLELEEILAERNLITHYQQSYQAELLLGFALVDKLHENPENFELSELRRILGRYEASAAWLKTLVALHPSGYFDHYKLRMAHANVRFRECSDANLMRIFPKEAIKSDAAYGAIFTNSGLIRWGGNEDEPAVGPLHTIRLILARAQAYIGLARTAIALERHYLASGSYPVGLNEIKESMQPVGGFPKDVASGNPPHYRRTGDRFILYFDGWNEKDDGGVDPIINHLNLAQRRSDSPHDGDWVWPTPKSAKEIAAARQKESDAATAEGLKTPSDLRIKRVKLDVAAIVTQVNFFKSQNSALPEKISDLVEKPSIEKFPKWRQIMADIPIDPWGSTYVLEKGTRSAGAGFDLYSLGPDRKAHTADDIGNW